MSNNLDPDQDIHSIVPDLGPNCLYMLSEDDKSRSYIARKELIQHFYLGKFWLSYRVSHSFASN